MELRHAEAIQKYEEEIKQLQGTVATQIEQAAILKKLLSVKK
jgi:hypothetical protein